MMDDTNDAYELQLRIVRLRAALIAAGVPVGSVDRIMRDGEEDEA